MTAPSFGDGADGKLGELLARLDGVKRQGAGWIGKCPGHNDKSPSLSIGRGDNGGIVLHCHAGCAIESVLDALGFTLSALFVDGRQNGAAYKPGQQATKPPKRYATADDVTRMYGGVFPDGQATNYDYMDAAGRHVSRVVRFDFPNGGKKAIRRCHLDGDAWVTTDMPAPKPLYNLRAILGRDAAELVAVVEGEKCTDRLAQIGIVAITSCGGANAPLADTDWTPLSGRHVVVLPDHDEPGATYAAGVIERARAAGARSVAVIKLDGLADGEDVYDWIAKREADGKAIGEITKELVGLLTTTAPPATEPAPANAPAGEPAAEERIPFPVSALPPALHDMVIAGAAAQGVDVGYWAVPLLGIVAGCIGSTRRVRISPTWSEPCVVWCAVIAPSGAGKSPPLRDLLKPVREHDYHLHEQTLERQRQHEADVEQWKAARPETRGPQPEPPPMLAAIVSDCTLEGLVARLVANPRGLLLWNDELAGWLRGQDRYRPGGGDEQAWLSIHGADAIKVDRKSAANGPARLYVRHAAVSLVGGIQPGIARRYLAAAEQRASGMCARVLLAAPPVTAARLTDATVPEHVHAAYSRVMGALLDLRLDPEGNPVDLPLTAAARERFRRWHDANGDACAAAARAGDDDMGAALSKLRGYAPRLALLVALARAAEDGTAELLHEVNDQDMAAGIAVADWFTGEAGRIYAQWAMDTAEDRVDRERGSLRDLAERLAGILASGPKDREELRAATHRNVPAPRIAAALAILRAERRADCDRIPGPRGGRPREVWRLTKDRDSA